MDSAYLTFGLALVVISFVLLIAELFIPSGGVLFALSIVGIAVGVTLTYFYSPMAGTLTLVGVVIALPTVGGAMLHYWQKSPMGRRFFLTSPTEDATVAALPTNKELEELRGRFGKTLSTLRPGGVADFDGRRVDVITEGLMVDPGQWVRCVDVRAGKVVVRPADRPPALDHLENTDFGS
jgi:membrane-bound serine protease (ClpP class)